jgi:hypothetical protein
VQAEFVRHHPEYKPDGVPGGPLILGDAGDPVSDGAAAQVRLRQEWADLTSD